MCIYEEGAQEACGEVRVAGITSQVTKNINIYNRFESET